MINYLTLLISLISLSLAVGLQYKNIKPYNEYSKKKIKLRTEAINKIDCKGKNDCILESYTKIYNNSKISKEEYISTNYIK